MSFIAQPRNSKWNSLCQSIYFEQFSQLYHIKTQNNRLPSFIFSKSQITLFTLLKSFLVELSFLRYYLNLILECSALPKTTAEQVQKQTEPQLVNSSY